MSKIQKEDSCLKDKHLTVCSKDWRKRETKVFKDFIPLNLLIKCKIGSYNASLKNIIQLSQEQEFTRTSSLEDDGNDP